MRSKKKEIDDKISNQIYYIPLYCYRHYPSIMDIYDYIVSDLIDYGRVKVFTSYDVAEEQAMSWLCDDDTYGVGCLDFTRGCCDAYLISKADNGKVIKEDTTLINSLDESKHLRVFEDRDSYWGRKTKR